MKKVFNVDSEKHVQLVKKVIESAFKGLTTEEAVKLKKLYKECEYEYYTSLKLKYVLPLGMLKLEYHLPKEVEDYVTYSVHTLIQQLPTHYEAGDEISIEFG
ncbi:hypothetical protein GJU41_02970 [Bacillus idriensis]|uniref:Uncharacterized protein n=1 Tax=Metabacillus idriensis TaxID=324768 RepID=A0A6I2MAT9_9BACI|nr:hypothetical protein [Metabacillus idriensis]MRX52923.1 hypothetical protein [Metabacillus idriensis]